MQGRAAGAGEHPGWPSTAPRSHSHSTGSRLKPTYSNGAGSRGTSLRSIGFILAFGLMVGLTVGIVGVLYLTSDNEEYPQSRSATQYRQKIDGALWGTTTPATPTTRGARIRVGNAADKTGLTPGQSAKAVQRGGSRAAVVSPTRTRTSPEKTVQGQLREQCPGLAGLPVTPPKKKRNLNVVLLATYPRSGNSWARTLFRTATQIKSDLTTVKGVSTLEEAGRLSVCPDCEVKEYTRMYSKLKLGWVSNTTVARPLYGIKGTAADTGACSELFTEKDTHEDQPWPYYPDHPPIMVKTHFPQIGDNKVEAFTLESVDRVVHIVRNPFDNIASRFLGNQRQHEDRFKDLVAARTKGQTTKAFSTFLELELGRLRTFHHYWFERRLSDAEHGVQTLYVRYEALCIDTPAVLRRMLEFSGYQILPKSLECTLANHKCHSANAAMPVHRDLFTEGQVAKILDTQARSLEAYGYVWNATTTSLDLVNSPLLCEW